MIPIEHNKRFTVFQGETSRDGRQLIQFENYNGYGVRGIQSVTNSANRLEESQIASRFRARSRVRTNESEAVDSPYIGFW